MEFRRLSFGAWLVGVPVSNEVICRIVECSSLGWVFGGARGVMIIVAGYGHGDTSSNSGPD